MIYRKIALLMILVLLSTTFVFSNSLKSREKSKADSDVIVEVVENVSEKIYPDNQLNWHYIVRKSAHLFEFFVLGVFTMILSLSFKKDRWKTVLCGFLYVFFVACTDEIIQRFTDRGSSFTDVMIDLAGASVGICVVLVLDHRIKWVRRSS